MNSASGPVIHDRESRAHPDIQKGPSAECLRLLRLQRAMLAMISSMANCPLINIKGTSPSCACVMLDLYELEPPGLDDASRSDDFTCVGDSHNSPLSLCRASIVPAPPRANTSSESGDHVGQASRLSSSTRFPRSCAVWWDRRTRSQEVNLGGWAARL